MRKLKLYVETSVWNFLFADDAPEKKEATEKFFAEVETGKYEIFISETVIFEIDAANPEKRNLLLETIARYNPATLETNQDVRTLVEKYLEYGLLSEKHFRDIQHIAHGAAHGMRAIVSWNQKHIVKMKTYDLVNAANMSLGYHVIQIWTPQEVIEDGRN